MLREREREGKRVLREFREMTHGLRPQDCGATESKRKQGKEKETKRQRERDKEKERSSKQCSLQC